MIYDPQSNFLQVSDWPADRLHHLLDLALKLKRELQTTGQNAPLLAGKTLAMIFEKPSLRTRVSFSVAMTHLGGTPLVLRQDEVGLDTREPTEDVARVLAGMVNGIMIRTFAQERVEKLAHYCSLPPPRHTAQPTAHTTPPPSQLATRNSQLATPNSQLSTPSPSPRPPLSTTNQQPSTTPVINGLTDLCHPCQALADIMTLHEHFCPNGGSLKGRTMAFIGDGNNVARSLAVACGKFGMNFILATPPSYSLPPEDIDRIMSQVPTLDFQTTHSPQDAVRNADAVVTDTWVSMGQEAEKTQRLKDFTGFRVDEQLLEYAPPHAVVLHCLPAYRDYEISATVLESARSLVFPEAHNRLHAQKAILAMLMA